MESHAGGPVTVAAIQAEIDDARRRSTPVRIAGRAHWMDAGRPVAAERTITTASYSGVVDYVPGDLTITVRSGTTLGEIAGTTGEEGQWFPLAPYGDDAGTIGATIATGSSGPLAQRFGGIRDLVLGLEFVSGEGKIVRGGGRVVKNVAGFDLTRLMTGSWGTLGIITEATLRLYASEARPATLVVGLPHSGTHFAARIAAVLAAPIVPNAIQLIDGATATRLKLQARTSLLIEVGGNAAAVKSQRDALAALGAEEIGPEVWTTLRLLDGEGSSVLRISTLVTRLAELWQTLQHSIEEASGTLMNASPGLGMVRCIVPASADAGTVARIAAAGGDCSVVFEKMSPQMWEALSPSVVADRVSRGIKHAFDPANILNPGILGE
ncbi:MAG: FAD-binding oxidoreductase [Gemmatimonadaceae bacterium]